MASNGWRYWSITRCSADKLPSLPQRPCMSRLSAMAHGGAIAAAWDDLPGSPCGCCNPGCHPPPHSRVPVAGPAAPPAPHQRPAARESWRTRAVSVEGHRQPIPLLEQPQRQDGRGLCCSPPPICSGSLPAHSSSLIEANLVMVLIMASVSVRCSASLSWSNYSHQFDELVAQRPRRVCRRDASMVYLSLAWFFHR